jgi:hypothetical protein
MDVTDRARLDATVTEADWPLVQRLWRLGLQNDHVYALLRLRLAIRQRGDPALDGLADDPRARFARWLVARGRLTEGT